MASRRTGSVRWAAVVLFAALLWIALGAGSTRAQETEFPPWPLLFEGDVYLDGEPVAQGEVTIRIGDWEGARVPVVDGSFRCADPCLIAGPPSFDYVGEPVTFHLDTGYVASFTFPFPEAGSPSRTRVELFFGALPTPAPRGQGKPSATPPPAEDSGTGVLVAVAAAAIVAMAAIGMSVYWLRKRSAR